MIDEKELRIGNWLHYEFYNQEPSVTVDCIVNNRFGKYIESNGNRISIDKHLKPIPLTPEILEKCGATKVYGNNYFIGKMKFDFSRHTNICRFHWSQKITYIHHLHQLQNLYFSLSGQELTITL